MRPESSKYFQKLLASRLHANGAGNVSWLLYFNFELFSQEIIKGTTVPANYPSIPVDQSLERHAADAITPVDLSIFV